MLVSLSEIMNVKDGIRKITVPVELENFSTQGETYLFHQKDSAILTVKNLGERKILIELKTNLSLLVPCDRCLKEVIITIPVDFTGEVDFRQTEEQRTENLDETSYIAGYDLDVDKLIYEELLISFPMKVLCREDCKGICRVCGADLNFGECGCERSELDPRMSVIRDIFNNFKEV